MFCIKIKLCIIFAKGGVPECRIHERSRLGPGYNWHHTGLPHHLEMDHKNIFRELLKGLIFGKAQKEGFTRRKISYISNNKHVVYFKGTNFHKFIP